LPFRAFFGSWEVCISKKQIPPSEVRKRGSIVNAWWPVLAFSDHPHRSKREDHVVSGTFSSWRTACPSYRISTIRSSWIWKILPHFSGEAPGSPGYDSSFLVSSGDPEGTSRRHTVYRHRENYHYLFIVGKNHQHILSAYIP